MAEESEDKQHLPTAKKIAELRKKGVVLRSRDLSAGIVLILCCVMIMMLGDNFYRDIINNFVSCYTSFGHASDYSAELPSFYKRLALVNFSLLLPLFAICFIGALLSPVFLGGWNFSWESIGFNLEKLNPFKNGARLFSPLRILFEIVKSFFKFLLLFITLVIFVYYKKDFIVNLMGYSTAAAMKGGYDICIEFVFFMLIAIVIIATFDIFYQRHEYFKQAKMTLQEIKDEAKDTEGNSDVKRKLRSVQFALSKQRLSVTVPRSTVVITNPTHYAVALRYDDKRDNAPIVLAKGTDQMARQIRHYAIANAIPIYEAPPLARAIFHTAKIGSEIPPGLYMAVAIVLSYVNQLKNYQMGFGPTPQYVADLEIPEEYVYDE